jgi:hypothetical protein
MYHVIFIRSRSGTRAVDRMEAQRRVEKACTASDAFVTKVEDARRYFIDASDGTRLQVYDPPPNSAKGKRTESVLETTFKTASLPVAAFLLTLAGEMRCAFLVPGSRDLSVPELDLQPARSAEAVTAQDLLDYVEQHGRVSAPPDRSIAPINSRNKNE